MKEAEVRAQLHAKLGQAAALGARLDKQEALLREGAKLRLKQVQDQIERTRIAAQTDPEAAKRYLELIEERGALWRVVGKT